MPRLHALMVAINEYPEPRNQLQGCINDLEEMKDYLSAHCTSLQIEFHPNILKDSQASRANIIEGFRQLSQAEDGDYILFFYAGHGARCPAPEAFWHLAPDKMNETLVCWDSRQEGERDLIDKELSYLIWSVTHDKEVTFVSITDCCHSGSNMRLEPVGERRTSNSQQLTPVEEYLGFEHYKKLGEHQYAPPRGRYIHLAASQAHETAKEIKAKGKKRGIFSYVLLESLKSARSPLPYTEIINRVRFRIRNYLQDQYPVLEATLAEDKKRTFLSDGISEQKSPYLISYNREKGWTVNAGTIHNLSRGSTPITFACLDDSKQVQVSELFVDHSTVTGMGEANQYQLYPAKLLTQPQNQIQVAIAADSETTAVDILKSSWSKQDKKLINLTDPEEARYLIHAKDNSFYLTSVQDARPLFKRVKGSDITSTEFFLAELNKVAHWINTQELHKADTSIAHNALAIELYQGTEPGNLKDDAPHRLIDWQEPGNFLQVGDQLPSFRFRVQNTTNGPLWLSVLYMGADFSITNRLMPHERLETGEEAWCSYLQKEHNIRTIPVMLLKTYHNWGLTQATSYLKVIVSTTPFDADQFNQEGLKLEEHPSMNVPTRSLAIIPDPPQEDWTTYTIPITVQKPLDSIYLHAQTPIRLFDHQITAPKDFRAKLRLQTLQQACLDLSTFPDLEIKPGVFLHPIELGPPQANPQLSVLELSGMNGLDNISAEHALQIDFRKEMPGLSLFKVYGLKDSRFYELSHHWIENHLHLSEIPPPQKEGQAIPIFFFTE